MQKHNKYFAEDICYFSNCWLDIFLSTRTNRDSAGQMRTLLSTYPNIAYLVATFGRDYSRNH